MEPGPYAELCITKSWELQRQGTWEGSSHIGWIAGTYTVKAIFAMTGDPLGNTEVSMTQFITETDPTQENTFYIPKN